LLACCFLLQFPGGVGSDRSFSQKRMTSDE